MSFDENFELTALVYAKNFLVLTCEFPIYTKPKNRDPDRDRVI